MFAYELALKVGGNGKSRFSYPEAAVPPKIARIPRRTAEKLFVIVTTRDSAIYSVINKASESSMVLDKCASFTSLPISSHSSKLTMNLYIQTLRGNV